MGAFNIPLMVDHPQFETPLDAQKQVLGLKQLAGVVAGQGQQQQLGSQELLLGEQKLQAEREKQRLAEEDARDSEAIKQSYSDAVKNTPEGKSLDLNSLRNTVASKVSPRALQSFDKSVQEHATAVAKIGKDQLEQNAALASELAKHVNAVAEVKRGDMSPEAQGARAAEWAKQVTIARQSGLDPNNTLPLQYPGDDQLGPLDISLRGTALHLTDEKARREAQDAVDKKRKEDAAQRQLDREEFADKLSTAISNGDVSDQGSYDDFLKAETPESIKSEVGRLKQYDPAKTPVAVSRMARTQAQQDTFTEKTAEQNRIATNESQTPDYKNYLLSKKEGFKGTFEDWQNKDANRKRPVTNNTFTAPALAVGADGKPPATVTIDQVPEAQRATVQRIVNGDQAMPPLGRNNPANQALNYWVGKVDPTYTAGRADLKKSFVSGKDAQNVTSLNTVIGHLGSLAEDADKLDNTTFKKYNDFGNWLSRETSTDKTAPFRVARRGVASELATALKGGVASQGEVDGWLKDIDTSDSPGTLKSTIAEVASVINSRMEALDAKRAELPEAGRSKPLLTDKSKSVIDKLTKTGNASGSPALPRELSSSDVGKVFVNSAGKKIKITAVNPANKTQFKFDPVDK